MKTNTHTLIKNSLLTGGAIVAAISANASTDYGPAIWHPTCNANWNTSGSGHKFHVVHDMEGYYLSTISRFTSCSYTSASVHYAINGLKDASSDAPSGEITQMILEANYAWHARCWNTYCTGTEHEGFANNPAWYTEAMYQASAGVSAHEATKFGYPKDRNHIVGHNEHSNANWRAYAGPAFGIDPTCNTHSDPGVYWDWNHYMNLVRGGSNPPPPPYNVVIGAWSGTLRNVGWYSNGTWKVWDGSTGGLIGSFGYGDPGDVPLVGAWTGNGVVDEAVFRPSTGTWYVRNGVTGGQIGTFAWGQNGDIPLLGAWSGNLADQTLFRPATGVWYIRNGVTGATSQFTWGQNGDVPLTGNWAGNGQVDEYLFRPSTGAWFVRNGLTGVQVATFSWGQSGDIPVLGAWSGQLRDTALFRPSTGVWYVRYANTGATTQFSFGQSGDIPAVANVYGNGVIDQVLFRPSTGKWYVRNGNTGVFVSF